uniref:Uncharacterized protein n=1 Tax=Rhizophora mucronata TaxID=61149 RepID=A0A2P2PXY3_RHIMU
MQIVKRCASKHDASIATLGYLVMLKHVSVVVVVLYGRL